MYIPKLFREDDHDTILAFLKANTFPALVTFDGQRPVASHLPVEISEAADGALTIFSHMSHANPQWKTFEGQEALFIFQGANTYISARWYGHVNVPTWNYMIVHAYGRLREIQGDELYSLLSRLVRQHEAGTSYSLEGLPQDYVNKEIRGVFGFAVEVTRLEAAWKLSQNRNDADHANIIRELEKREDAFSHEIASSMRRQRGASEG